MNNKNRKQNMFATQKFKTSLLNSFGLKKKSVLLLLKQEKLKVDGFSI